MKSKLLIRSLTCGLLLLATACGTVAAPPTPTSTPPPPTPTDTPPADQINISPELIAELDNILANLASKDLFSGSVLIGYQDTVLLSQGYGLADRQQNLANTAQTKYRLGELTYQFTAMAILILASQGKLTVDDPICTYFVDCPAAWETITIKQLLTHTSGIPDFANLPDYQSTLATPSPPEQTIARFKDLPLEFQPGKGYSFSHSDYILLGAIIEQVSGQSYESFLQQSIFTPLNLMDTGYYHNENNLLAVGYADKYQNVLAEYIDMSIPYAAGALYSTVEDYYRWLQALSTEQLVPKAYVDEMFAPQVNADQVAILGFAYGYGWYVGEYSFGLKSSRQAALHGGLSYGYTQQAAFFPDDQIVFIILSNKEGQDLLQILNLLAKKLFDS